MYWGIITIQMLNLGFPFTNSELFTLTAIAGLSGATLRIPSSFFIRICGGRNTIVFTTALLIIPAVGTGLALQDKNTSLLVFQVLALLSGIGGGNFASSAANISFFFPKKRKGFALGLNAGLGNLGVTTMQILVPLVMTFGVFGGEPMELVNTSGTLIGKIPAGSDAWIHNAAYVWLLFLVPLVLVGWWGMNNIIAGSDAWIHNAAYVWLLFLVPLVLVGWWGMNNIITPQVTPDLPSPVISFSIISGMLLIGILAAVFGIWLMMPERFGGSGLEVSMWIVLPMIVAMTVFMLRLIPGKVKENLTRQYEIFGNKHTWVMSIIYTMTFGSLAPFTQ
jgi:NNP family nitrate/nitrite transporter-like MFS transporter